jgi:hypothetical protein
MLTYTEMREIELVGKKAAGKVVLVDDYDYKWLSRIYWFLGPGNYPAASFGWRETIYMHHMLLPLKPGLEVDHINRNKLDCRRDNLRYLTRGENARNCLRKDCFTGIRGVTYHPSNDYPYEARCSFKSRYYYLGKFKTKEEAGDAYVDFLSKCNADPSGDVRRHRKHIKLEECPPLKPLKSARS